MAVTKNNNSANADSNAGFKTVAFGFDKNDVTMYIASLRKKMKQMEEEFDEKLNLAIENPAASSEALKRERENIRAEMEKNWSDKINDRNIIIKQQQRDLDSITKEADDLKVKNETLRSQLSSAISAAAAANANRSLEAEASPEEVSKANAEVLAQAEENKALAEEYKSRTERYKKLAEEYQAELIQFKSNADQFKDNAAQYKDNAEQHKKNEEMYKANAEQYKASAEQYKEISEKYKTAIEQYKKNAESYKTAAAHYKEWAEKYQSQIEKFKSAAETMYEQLKSSMDAIGKLVGSSVSESEKTWGSVSGIAFEKMPDVPFDNIKEPEALDIADPEPIEITEVKPVDIIEPELAEPEELSIDDLAGKLEAVESELAEESAARAAETEAAKAAVMAEIMAETPAPAPVEAIIAEEPAADNAAPADDDLSSIITDGDLGGLMADSDNSGSDDLGSLMADDDLASIVEEVPAPAASSKNKKSKEKPKKAEKIAQPFDPFAEEDDDLSSLLADPSAESVIRPANGKGSATDDFADLLAGDDEDISDDLKDFLITEEPQKVDAGIDLDPNLLSDMVIDSSEGNNGADLSEMLQQKTADEYSQFGDLFVEPADNSDSQFDIKAENGDSIDELKNDDLSGKKAEKAGEADPFDFTFNENSDDDDDMSTDL